MTLDEQYEADMQKEKIEELASKIWNAINEVFPDPMHPQFESFIDPVKDEVISFATRASLGFANEAGMYSIGYAPNGKVKIGDMEIIRQSDSAVWIQKQDGEGAEFSDDKIYPVIASFYRANF